jgi:tetratricopeptide (TPR) repeat protein
VIVLCGRGATELLVRITSSEIAIVSSHFEDDSEDRSWFHVMKENNMSENKLRLAHIHIEQADISRTQGSVDSAVEYFTKAINIYKELADEEPACYVLIADTIERVAATYKAAGKLKEAEETFAEAVQLRQAIAKREQESSDD